MVIENNDIELLTIENVIDINLLQNFQDKFAQIMEFASVTVDKNGNPVTKPSLYTSFCADFVHSTILGNKRCAECHRKGGEIAALTGKPYIYTCHAGLIDFATPILVNGKLIGTILGGQVLTKKPDESTYKEIAKEIGVDECEFFESAKKVKIITEKNLKDTAEVLFLIANALSQIGYEELMLKNISKKLEIKVEESEKYNELKTQLFFTISHELKTPLNIIFSSIQLLDSIYKNSSVTQETEVFYKYSGIMKQNCYRLLRLTNNIIDVNKMELGFSNLHLSNGNIVKFIEDITLSIVDYAKLKKINVVFDTEAEEIITSFDPEKLERIVLNLLSNSIKFTEPGGYINVNIFDKDEYILISVRDTGIGIPCNMIDKIFDIFTQVDGSFTRNAEGSGIGLSIVKFLVEMHGWKITVNSELNKGSNFIISVPIKLVEKQLDINNTESGSIDRLEENIKIEFSDIYL